MRRTLITLIFSVVAMEPRTFSSFSYSANKQMCQSWRKHSQPKLANENISYHRRHARFPNGVWLGSRKLSALLVSVSLNPLLCRSLNFFFQYFSLFQEFYKICKICEFGMLQSLLRDRLQIGHQVVRKTVLYIACFPYSLL